MAIFARGVALLRSRRVISGSAANFTTLFMVLVVQLVSVPVFSATLGLERFGIWLILSTIPNYLILSDIGLTTAAQNDMAMRAAAGDEDEVVSIFQSISIAIAIVLAVITAVTVLLVLATSPIDGFWPDDIAPYVWVIPLLTGYAALYMIAYVPIAALRATGYYARATIIHDSSTFLESLSMMAAAIVTRDLVVMAAAPMAIRALTLPLMYLEMRRLRPYLSWGLRHASWAQVKRLLPAAIGNMAIPVALALNIQGMVLVVGSLLGPVAVAMFAPVRTASRLAGQLVGAVNRAIVPELSAARGRGDKEEELRLWRINDRLIWLALVPAAILFALFGSEAVALWTGGRIDPAPLFVAIMAISMAPHASWYYRLLLLSASHEHIALAKSVVGVSALGLGIAAAAAPLYGLPGVAAALVLTDVILLILVGRQVREKPR